MQNRESRLGTELMLPLLLRMALPSVAAQLINLLYSIIDRIFIGHIDGIGTNALAGVGVTGSVIILITAFSAIVGMGGAPLAAIALGRGNRDEAGYIMGNGFSMLVVFSVMLSLLTYLFMEPILLFTGASEATLGYATDYLSIYLFGTLFVLISVGLNSFITVQGRPGIAMWSVIIGAIINIVLDYVFIFNLNLGVKGAAYATVISQGCSAVWVIYFLTSKKASLPLKKVFMRFRTKVVLSILALGMSPFVMASTEALVGFVLNGSLKHYGDIHISTMAVIQSALLMTSIPLTGFAQGFTPIASYNYGAGNTGRVKQCFKISLMIMGAFNFLLILSMILFPRVVASIFTNDIELIDMVQRTLPIFLLGMTLFGLQRTCQSMFIALGQAKISIFIAVLRKLILLIPLALILPAKMGVMGIYWAEAISDATAAICCFTIFMIVFPKIMARREAEKL
ncbi:MAG: MATE family efflux transporter [Rikenellaceae bacterium]